VWPGRQRSDQHQNQDDQQDCNHNPDSPRR
jgi:hypothetical protein